VQYATRGLALGIGKSAGATLTMIAEELPRDEPIRLSHLLDILETSMIKRIAHGRPFGVAVIAEGIGLRLPQDEPKRAMPEVERDEHGNVRLVELELDRLLARQVKGRDPGDLEDPEKLRRSQRPQSSRPKPSAPGTAI
jgi:hypothetical protein